MDTAEEHRCMVRLMKMALGLNEQQAEAFLSPTKDQNGTNGKAKNGDIDELDIVVD